MAEVYIAIGSNLGNRLEYLRNAVNSLNKVGKVLAIAKLYQSGAYGYSRQPSFYNSAVLLETKLAPVELLNALKNIEKKGGRKKRVRWGPREIDLDIIFYDQKMLQTKQLTLPHPDFHNRRFVLQPLADIAPDFVSPTHRKSVLELLNNCQDSTKNKLIETEWYSNGTQI